MNPVTEIGFFTFIPTANIQEAMAGVDDIPGRQPGIRNLRWGFGEDDKTKVQLIANWDDLRYHEQFTQSGADYAAVGDILTPILAAPPAVFHAHLDQDTLAAVVDASLVEMITFYSVSEGFQDILRGTLSTKCTMFVDAPVIEDIAQQPGGVNGSAHFAAIVRSSEAGCPGDWALPGSKGFESHYVRF